MRKIVGFMLALICVLGLVGCGKSKPKPSEPHVVNTFETTHIGLIEDSFDNSKVVTTKKYYEMSDGTWKTDEHTYKYRLEITGRLNNAEKDSTYVILSNIENITFEQAWKASGLSSNSNDYFKEEEAVFVGVS